jgi:mannose-6-phosphate isomerase-like protein (cupin superfamily)
MRTADLSWLKITAQTRPSGKGPEAFHRHRPRRPDVSGGRSHTHQRRPSHSRARCPHVWHTHPLGQTLIVTSGLGWVQSEGGPIEEIRPGDVVWFPPGEKHWHGATAMINVAILILDQGEEAFKSITEFADRDHRRFGIGDRSILEGKSRLVRSRHQEIQAD